MVVALALGQVDQGVVFAVARSSSPHARGRGASPLSAKLVGALGVVAPGAPGGPCAGRRRARQRRIEGGVGQVGSIQHPEGLRGRGQGHSFGVYLSHLWARLCPRGLPRPWALPDVRHVLAPPWGRAPAPSAAGRRDRAAVQPLCAADRGAHTRPVQSLLRVLAPVWCRAPVAPPASASLPDVRAARAGLPPRPVQCVLPVLAPDRPRAPPGAVEAPIARGCPCAVRSAAGGGEQSTLGAPGGPRRSAGPEHACRVGPTANPAPCGGVPRLPFGR
jgi:hypothetical protein